MDVVVPFQLCGWEIAPEDEKEYVSDLMRLFDAVTRLAERWGRGCSTLTVHTSNGDYFVSIIVARVVKFKL